MAYTYEQLVQLGAKPVQSTQPTLPPQGGRSYTFEELQMLGAKPKEEVVASAALPTPKKPFKLGSAIHEFALGAGTGVLSTVRESSELVKKGLSYLPKQIKEQAPLPLRAVAKIAPIMSKFEGSVGATEKSLTKYPETIAGKAGYITEKIAELVNPAGLEVTASAAKKPLTVAAESLYRRALKPSEDALKQGVIKTGLNERIWLTQGGVEKVANKIDDWENLLGKAIDEGKTAGVAIKTSGIKSYLNEAKKLFQYDLDPQKAKNAVKEIDEIGQRFLEEYGKELPIDIAQKIKVATGQSLRKYYGELSGAAQEGKKQGVRFLKEAIVEKAPQVGDINKRLKNLYQFDQALSKASRRIGNLNLLGLGAKFGAVTGGSKGAAIGFVADLLDKAAIKSGAGIGLNELSKLANKKGAIPINALVGLIRSQLDKD